MAADPALDRAPARSEDGSGAAGAFACVARAWDAHEAELRGYLRHRMADAETADDALQDVFVKAMRQGRAFCTLDNPRAWLFQVARNAVVDRLRASRNLEPLTDELVEGTPLNAEPIAPIDALSECVARTLGELSPEDAAILRACDLEGQTQIAFAHVHGLSLSAAKSRLLRARQRLREHLVANCQVSFDEAGRVCCHVPREP